MCRAETQAEEWSNPGEQNTQKDRERGARCVFTKSEPSDVVRMQVWGVLNV